MNDPAPKLEPATPTIWIGEWRFDHTRNELSRAGAVHRLPRREVELLLRLAASPGETVTREQLLADVWTRRMVNDEVLSRAIADLRQVLHDDARAPSYIETIPKVGYRLVAAVRDAADAGGEARVDAAAGSHPDPVPPSRRPAMLVGVVVVAALVLALLAASWWLRAAPGADDPLRVENLLRTQPLTSDPGWELAPRFTSDGRSVLYSRVESSESETASIWIRALDGTLSEKLVDDGKWNLCPTPSPDGTRMAWLSMDREHCTLVERPLLGGEVRELATCAAGLRACPDWSPDGGALLYTAAPTEADRGPALMRVDVATLASVAVMPDATPRDMNDVTPRYSPDGQRIAFQRGNGWGGLYYVVDAAGGQPRALGTRAELNYGLAWARDGRRLLLATDALGYRALVAQDAAGGAMQLLGARGARHPDVSRQGALVWEHAEYDANLWLVGLGADGAVPRQLTTARRYDAQPEYSPDGRRVAFMSNRDGSERIYLIELDSGTERGLATPGSGRWAQVAWSPDGQALTATTYDAESSRGCVYVLASSHTECPEALRGVESLRLAADGTFLALRGTDERRDLWRIDTRAGASSELASGVERFFPAGERLLIQRRDQPGIVLREADGRERVLGAEFGPILRGLWSATREALYLGASASSGKPPGLYRLAFADPAPERVSGELPDTVGPALTIAPDGRHAVIGRTDRLDVDLHWVPPPQ